MKTPLRFVYHHEGKKMPRKNHVKESVMKKSILRLSALLLVLVLFPVSVLGEAVDVEDVKMLNV